MNGIESQQLTIVRSKFPEASMFRLKGYSSSNRESDERKRYQEAKLPIGKGWNADQTESDEHLLSWIQGGGWIGLRVPQEFIIVDIDDREEGRTAAELLTSFKIQHYAIQTPNGYQFIFRDAGTVGKQNVKMFTQAGFVVDYRLQGKGYVVIPCGENTPGRQWTSLEHDDAAVMPNWFKPIKSVNNKNERPFTLPIHENGRNNTVFQHAARLVEFKIPEHEVESTILMIGQHLCSPPLEERELRTIIGSATKYSPSPFMPNHSYADVSSADARGHETPVFDSGDIGNSQRLIFHYGEIIRYCPPFKTWYVWNGRRWEADGTGELIILASTIHEKIKEEIERAEEQFQDNPEILKARVGALRKQAAISCSYRGIQAMINLAAPNFPISPEHLDADPWLLNVRNGTIDLKTGILMAHNPDQFLTKMIDLDYNPDADCPRWERFMEEVIQDKKGTVQHDVIKYLKKAFGYSLTGRTSEHVLFFFVGNGRNGKGVLLNTIHKLMGDYAEQANADTFLAKQHDSNVKNDIAKLKGARFVIASESEKGSKLSEALVKQLTGGDPISARFLHKDFFTFLPEFKIFFSTNYKPKIGGQDYGIWERMRKIDFNVRFEEAQRDKNLVEDLEKEFTGILAWMVEGCSLWQTQGLGEPEALKDSKQAYRAEMDSIGVFVEDELVIGPTATVKTRALLDAYKAWCDENGEYEHKKGVLYDQLTEWAESRGFTISSALIGPDRARGYKGIGLRADFPVEWQEKIENENRKQNEAAALKKEVTEIL